MSEKERVNPFLYLGEYKGKFYKGSLPTLTELFTISVERWGSNKLFIAFNPTKLEFTYDEAYKKIREIASYLIQSGVKKGDKIAVCGKNSPEWAITYLAILFSGATVVPLDHSLKEEEMDTLLRFGGVDRIFIDNDKISKIDSESDYLKERYSLDSETKEYQYSLNLVGDTKGVSFPSWKEDEVCAILFTSGTTGVPKGVMLTNRNLVSDCLMAQWYMPLYPTDVFYAILPLHHAYTMVAVFIETISCGASCVFGKKLAVTQILRELKEGKVTMFLAVPVLFNGLLRALLDGVKKKGKLAYAYVRVMMAFSGFVKKVFGINIGKRIFSKMLLSKVSLDTNRICISGGGPLPAETFKKFNQLGIDFVQGYGLTETSPITHLNPVDAYNENSVGMNLPGIECKIVDPDSEGNGVIYVKGPMVMKGYYNNADATEEILGEDGWLNTGDVGHQDEKGYLYLTGRAKNIIVTEGGKNVFPEEIEDKFQLYSQISQICIIGYIKDKKLKSEGIRALVYPSDSLRREKSREEQQAEIEAIISEVNRELQSYKKITMVTVVDEPLEMTSTKKIKRFAVQKKYAL